MKYLLDANVFIQAKNLHYGFDFCPAFWDWLDKRSNAGDVSSVEKVAHEIKASSDELSAWAAVRPNFFVGPGSEIVPSLREVSKWANESSYKAAAVNTFLQVGDYYLVAHAHALGVTVVTHEVPSNSQKKIKIPNVCLGLNIKCMSPYEMLRVERARFVLGSP